jgi:hypothetical protein
MWHAKDPPVTLRPERHTNQGLARPQTKRNISYCSVVTHLRRKRAVHCFTRWNCKACSQLYIGTHGTASWREKSLFLSPDGCALSVRSSLCMRQNGVAPLP